MGCSCTPGISLPVHSVTTPLLPRGKQSCMVSVTPAKERTEECSDHWGFPLKMGKDSVQTTFFPARRLTTSVTPQLRSRPCPGEFEMWHLYLPHSRPGGVILPLLSCTLGSEGSVSVWQQLLAQGGLPVPVLGLLEFTGHGPSLAPVSHKAQTRLLLLVENLVIE